MAGTSPDIPRSLTEAVLYRDVRELVVPAPTPADALPDVLPLVDPAIVPLVLPTPLEPLTPELDTRPRSDVRPPSLMPEYVPEIEISHLSHAQIVLHMTYPGNILGDIFGQPFGIAAVHMTIQRDFAILHGDIDVGCVDDRIIGQPIAHILADALIGPRVAARTASAMHHIAAGILGTALTGFFVTKPGGNLIAGPIPQPALAAR